jgi:diguanylate cyclase (GGDEF)-like protein
MNIKVYGGYHMREFIEKTCIYMLIDSDGRVYYCNKEKSNEIIKIIKELKIIDYVKEGKFGERIFNDYSINIQEISMDNEKMYLIVLDTVADKISILEHSVFLDYHTGLYNRNLWEYWHQSLISMLNCQTYSVILIDIDNLKKMNDTEGHSAGDIAIKIVADTIKESIRKEDIVIRLGGDEFLVILPNMDIKASNKVIDRVRSILLEKSKSKNCKIDISAGVSFGDQLDCLQNIVQRADCNMYAEKRSKKKI